jgi:23S rRNA (uracil1939-C5)-methyltransferase
MAVCVSCNPEALADDLRIIVSHGYRIVSMGPVDMLPHTAHVETVVVVSAPARRS